MFSSRRLAKRSIIGTRVCCQWQDGRYYPGIIQNTDTTIAGEDYYTVYFDDGYTKRVFEKDIVGPGFQSVTVVRLKKGQRVFVTHNGREVCGIVLHHDVGSDDVMIITMPNQNGGSELELTRKLEEVRLLESRKSARLQDQDTDYSRLADFHPEPKKRAVSHVIDVPSPAPKHSRRRTLDDEEEPMDMECDDADDGDSREGDTMLEMMDENMAAMVLTSLSCSPVSPHFPPTITDKGSVSPGVSSSLGSSGVYVKSEASTPSPPQHLNRQPHHPPMFDNSAVDEGIELDDTHAYFMDESKPSKMCTRTMYKCTWPGCTKILNTNMRIEEHVREEHLGPRDSDEDSDMSDHEEEFYYTEIEVSVDTVTETFADMYTSSPPSGVHIQAVQTMQDHDYQKKEPRSLPQAIPGRRSSYEVSVPHGASFPVTFTGDNQQPLSRSWQLPSTSGMSSISPPLRITKNPSNGHSKAQTLSSSPKSSPMHKKSRSEIKKCRKVYGMENRDLWCTQCKWKKACSRFLD